MDIDKLKYPIGKFRYPKEINASLIDLWIEDIRSFTDKLKNEVEGLSEDQVKWRYRPEGWNIQQVVHHCADSHMNSLVRFKLTLTEDKPTVKAYFEDRWAELSDSTSVPIEWSLTLLDGLHKRWVHLLKSLEPSDLLKTFIHPESGREIRIDENIALYSWHSNHHLAHVQQAKRYEGNFN